MDKLREFKEYDGNPVGLSKEVAKEIATHLDRHLAAFMTLYHQYHKHHWLVEGPQFRDLHLFFEDNYNQIHEGFDALAERLTVMGYDPTSNPADFAKLSYVQHEPKGIFRIRESLENDMEAERSIAIELRKSIKKAFELEDYATKNLLEKLLFNTEDRAHHIEHFLGEDSLTVGFLHTEKEAEAAEA
ncbi:DNA starvation/stationary phase protection protein [Porifericola rhodea]|uniref:Dps family protein n=1 Tax=Porifericola rhodea TaxID=930972 RepID=UPI0026662291|nr:DNA starvation/stationary phase protection protein [Porifericola rhodea]WKN31071.1 DNA starvation/stationary phase protection protein [Porifericola rhodea]